MIRHFLPLLAMTPRTITFAGALEKGLIQIVSSTSDTGRLVRYLMLWRLIRISATKSFSSEKRRTLPESSFLSLRSNCLALSWRYSRASMIRTVLDLVSQVRDVILMNVYLDLKNSGGSVGILE
jgi:hypothetical protein